MQPASTAPVIRVVLADDHDLVRTGMKALLTLVAGVEVIAEARDGNELIQVVDRLNPDLVMTDISMPGMDGITAIARIHESHPTVRLLVLSTYNTVDFVKRAVAGGACGYLMKDAPLAELEQAVRSIATRGSYFSPAIVKLLLQASGPTVDDGLTQRQIEILTMISQGHAAKEIGFELGISSKTVNVHRARIMERLRLNDVANLTLYAVRKGLVKL